MQLEDVDLIQIKIPYLTGYFVRTEDDSFVSYLSVCMSVCDGMHLWDDSMAEVDSMASYRLLCHGLKSCPSL